MRSPAVDSPRLVPRPRLNGYTPRHALATFAPTYRAGPPQPSAPPHLFRMKIAALLFLPGTFAQTSAIVYSGPVAPTATTAVTKRTYSDANCVTMINALTLKTHICVPSASGGSTKITRALVPHPSGLPSPNPDNVVFTSTSYGDAGCATAVGSADQNEGTCTPSGVGMWSQVRRRGISARRCITAHRARARRAMTRRRTARSFPPLTLSASPLHRLTAPSHLSPPAPSHLSPLPLAPCSLPHALTYSPR